MSSKLPTSRSPDRHSRHRRYPTRESAVVDCVDTQKQEQEQQQQQDPAGIASSAVAAAAAYYQHCWDVLMKADSLPHHHLHHHHPSDGRSPPPPTAMDHRHHHRLPNPPPLPPPSWMTAMAASTIPWPFIPQVLCHFEIFPAQWRGEKWSETCNVCIKMWTNSDGKQQQKIVFESVDSL